jgi:hypothetical protein
MLCGPWVQVKMLHCPRMTQPSEKQIFFWRIVSGLVATSYAGLATPVLHRLLPRLDAFASVMTFVILWLGFYLVWMWISVERPAELRKKSPITGKEVRERRKAFHDWLASSERHIRRNRARGPL